VTHAPEKPTGPKAKAPASASNKASQPPKSAAAARGGSHFVDDYLGYLLGQANHALFKDFENEVRAARLGSLEWRVLATLSDRPPMPVGQLAQEVLSQQPTVTKLVQRLAAQRWVTLTNDPADQRRTLVHISAAGLRKVNPLIARAKAHETEMLTQFSEEDMARLKQQLRRLARPRHNKPPRDVETAQNAS
jgi:DNA-binding MarR family transcriptional regulator